VAHTRLEINNRDVRELRGRCLGTVFCLSLADFAYPGH